MELTTASSSEIDIITYTNNTINKIIVLFIVTISIIVLINYYLFLHFVYNKQQKNNNTNNIIHNNIHSSINDIREKIKYLERFVAEGQCDQLESVHDIQRILTERSNKLSLFEITLTNLRSEMDDFQHKIQSLIKRSSKIEHIETTLSNMRSDMTDIDNKTLGDFNKINTIICEQNGKKNDIQDKLNELNSKNEQIQTILKSNIINLIELQTNLDNNIVKRIEKNTNSIEKLQNNDDIKNIKMDMVTLTSQMNTIDSSSNKNIDLLREQIQNSSTGFTMIPLKSGSYCDINCETLLFCGIYTSSDPFNNRLTGVKLCVGDKNHILLEDIKNYTTDSQVFRSQVFRFLEQFRKIKSIYFEIGGTNIDYHTENALAHLFHHLIKMNPHMDIHFKCKDIWHDPLNNASEILKEFIKTTNYSSFHLEIENNYVKDAQTGNMRNVSSVVSNKIKEHCVNNNINFVSNIGI
jgi:hypothetical protein